MLTITDQAGKPKFILRDGDSQPIKIDELILNDEEPDSKKKRKKDDSK